MKKQVKSMLLDRFRDMASLYGIKRITIEKLARECGISKKTVYNFFASKDEMVNALADSILGALSSNFESINRSHENPLQKLYKYFEFSFSLFSNFSTLLLDDVQRYYPEINDKLNAFIDDLSSLFMDNYRMGVKKGLFIELNPNFVAGFFKGASEMVFKPDFILKNNLTIEETIYSFRTLLISALVKK